MLLFYLDDCKRAQQNKRIFQQKVLQYAVSADQHDILALPPFSLSFPKAEFVEALKISGT